MCSTTWMYFGTLPQLVGCLHRYFQYVHGCSPDSFQNSIEIVVPERLWIDSVNDIWKYAFEIEKLQKSHLEFSGKIETIKI